MADVDPPLVVYNATPGSEMQMEPVSKPSFWTIAFDISRPVGLRATYPLSAGGFGKIQSSLTTLIF